MLFYNMILLVLTFPNFSFSRRLREHWPLYVCHIESCQSTNSFNCKCEHDEWADYQTKYPSGPIRCIPGRWMCDGWKDCDDGSDEMDCTCSSNEMGCSYCLNGGGCDGNVRYNLYQCIPNQMINNGIYNCLNRRDEPDIYPPLCGDICDGSIDCRRLDPNDESSCSQSLPPDRKSCGCDINKTSTCGGGGRCNSYIDCVDTSDEVGCPCEENQFQCQCYKDNPITCASSGWFIGCIPAEKYHNGIKDCPDGSDESKFERTVSCDGCSTTVHRLNDRSECEEKNHPQCDPSTCYEVYSLNCSSYENCNTTEVICTSKCSNESNSRCNRGFQCEDGTLILLSQFCDGKYDCHDHSDEIRDDLGFKCVEFRGTCVLPQRNIFDNVSHCSGDLDVDCNNNMTKCFRCLDDRLLISSEQLCDGMIDCYDLSDECLCQVNIDNPRCNVAYPFTVHSNLKCTISNTSQSNTDISGQSFRLNSLSQSSTIKCYNKWGIINATLCDFWPECRDLSDECSVQCTFKPAFCNDTCHSYYPIGDRYCDGVPDQVSEHIKSPVCNKGFDEFDCSNRFSCSTGNVTSINVDQRCDGRKNCDDGSDEENCPRQITNIFSSNKEMIENPSLRACFWVMGLLVLFGNTYVIITSSYYLKTSKMSKSLRFQHVNILNISIADFIMGIYLLTIASFSALYSGVYGQVDFKWRSSLRCSVIGSLAVISSEASCLLMVVLTLFRLRNIFFPFAPLTSTTTWKLCIPFAWLISIVIAGVPIILQTSQYFVQDVWFSNRFTKTPTWEKFNIAKFSCRLASLTNLSIDYESDAWQSINAFLKTHFPSYAPEGEFGYYGETSVCMPKFFLTRYENAWEYSLTIITLNFLCFVFIALSYILIYIRSTKRPAEFKNKNTAKQEATMQRRIARIIATDFLCWIPICTMAYIRLSGLKLDKVAYVVSAAVLLPINSAFNPLLYSSLVDNFIALFQKKSKENKTVATRSTEVKSNSRSLNK